MTDPLYGNRIESFRVELLDHQDRIIGDLDGVIGGELSWNDNAPIPGGGSLDLTDLGQDIDFSSNRLRPYLRLAVPKREGVVPQPGAPVWTEERRNFNEYPSLKGVLTGWSTQTPWTASATMDGRLVQTATAAAGGPAVFDTVNGATAVGDRWSAEMEVTVPAGYPAVTAYLTVYSYGQNIYNALGDPVTIQPGETKVLKTKPYSTVTSASTGVRTILYASGPAGARFVARNAIRTKTVESEPYFDGSTPSTDPAIRNRWLGAVGSSISVQERGSLSVPEATIVPDTGPGFVEWPLGVYVMAAPSTEYSATGQRRTIDLVDKITVISDDRITETLQVAQGANIVAAVQQQIQATGETRILATASTATLTNTMTWEPGTSRLRIINDLLSVAGYWSLSTDRSGQFLVQPYIAPADRPVAWSFEEGAASLHSPEWEHEMPLWEATNHVTFVSQENDAGQVWVAYAIDDNPDSPTSTVNMKRVLNPIVEENVEASSQLDLQTQANRKLRDNSNVVGQMSVSHAFIPVWYRDSVSFKSQGVDTKATIVEMSMRLEPGALVEARWRQA